MPKKVANMKNEDGEYEKDEDDEEQYDDRYEDE